MLVEVASASPAILLGSDSDRATSASRPHDSNPVIAGPSNPGVVEEAATTSTVVQALNPPKRFKKDLPAKVKGRGRGAISVLTFRNEVSEDKFQIFNGQIVPLRSMNSSSFFFNYIK